jgi:hypothetical protein
MLIFNCASDSGVDQEIPTAVLHATVEIDPQANTHRAP